MKEGKDTMKSEIKLLSNYIKSFKIAGLKKKSVYAKHIIFSGRSMWVDTFVEFVQPTLVPCF